MDMISENKGRALREPAPPYFFVSFPRRRESSNFVILSARLWRGDLSRGSVSTPSNFLKKLYNSYIRNYLSNLYIPAVAKAMAGRREY
jgi:hypothetical protein